MQEARVYKAITIAIASWAALAVPGTVEAETVAAPVAASQAGPSAVAGWDELVGTLARLPDRYLALLPEPMRRDPQIQQEVARLALEALTSKSLDALGSDPDHPEFLPLIGYVLNVGQPNADTVYRQARIDPSGSYRLSGWRGSSRIAAVGQIISRPYGTGPAPSYLDLSRIKVNLSGHFDVILSSTRPVGWTGEWWPLVAGADKLVLRIVASDWSREKSPTISIERIDRPVARQRRTAADLEARLRALPRITEVYGRMFVNHVPTLRAEGWINKFKVMDLSQMGSLAGQFYYEGPYEIGPDEALIVESAVPRTCRYRSLILTNDIYETLDWYNNQSSLNDTQAAPDSDGRLRIVIANRDPGVPNWLDTAGHLTGLIQGRWTECDSQPIPTITRIPLADLRQHLPPGTASVTPDQREASMRARRAAQLQRPLW